ncbi:MAG: glycosyltransferase family 4 protein [Planctomycetales bacterium]|nr:glycosyltransferase family 4 protein [Planctomycetales bacterium]
MSENPRVIILNQMAGPMTWELAEDLSQRWGRIAMLTGHPDTLAKGSQGHLELYPSVAYRRGSLVRRFGTWFRYAVHAFFWLWRWPRDVPLLVFSNPPLGLWLAWLMRKLRGTRYAVMVHDIYPDVAIRLGRVSERSLIARLWRWLNRLGYTNAEVVMTLGEQMKTVLDAQFDASRTPAGRVEVIPPWCDTTRIHPRDKRDNPFAQEYQQVDKLTVMYSGNMGLGHDLETMVAAADSLRHDNRCHFLFIGDGPKWQVVHSLLARNELTNATLLGWQPESQIPWTLACADVAMVSLEREMAGLAIPSKAFYSLAAGTPLIVLCESQTELGQLVTAHGCGWQLEPGNTQGFTMVLEQLLDDPLELQRRREASRRVSELIGARDSNSPRIEQLLRQYLEPSGG